MKCPSSFQNGKLITYLSIWQASPLPTQTTWWWIIKPVVSKWREGLYRTSMQHRPFLCNIWYVWFYISFSMLNVCWSMCIVAKCFVRAECVQVLECAHTQMLMNNFPILSIFALDMLIQMLDKSHGEAWKTTANAEEKRQNDTETLNCLKFA